MCLPGTQETVRERAEREGLPQTSRRAVLTGAAASALAAAVPGAMAAPGGGRPKTFTESMRDLTHVFREGFPVYSFDRPVRRTLVTVEDDGFYSQQWSFPEHAGTHVDAPGHFVTGGRFVSELTPAELFAPIVVINIQRKARINPDSAVTRVDLKEFESRHGRIPNRAVVCMYSGWERRVGSQKRFRNRGPDGKFHFPGFSVNAAEWLLEKRDITGIGVDTLSLDRGRSTTFGVHLAILGADKFGIENLANLNTIPRTGASIFVGVIPWEEGSGGPCRVIARW
jgi:kynurenine formamidase